MKPEHESPATPGAGRTLLHAARSAVRQLAAVLSFDSADRQPAVVGMRSAAGLTRHLLYSAHGRDIDLRISQDGDGYVLSGQILGADEGGAIELAGCGAAAGSRRQAQWSAGGEFELPELSHGVYELRLRLGGDVIQLPPVELR